MIAFEGLSTRADNANELQHSTELHAAAKALRDDCIAVLGRPSSSLFPMRPRTTGVASKEEEVKEESSDAHGLSTAFLGLRIGKVECRTKTDVGMAFDGQYAHYTDKFLLALVLMDDPESLDMAAQLMIELARIFITPTGIHWKLNVDSSPVRGLGPASVHSDTLMWAITASLLAQKRLQVAPVVEQLRALLSAHPCTVVTTTDPLGWGLEWLALAHLADSDYKRDVDIPALISAGEYTLHPKHFKELPFRLYGIQVTLLSGHATREFGFLFLWTFLGYYDVRSGVPSLIARATNVLNAVAATEEAQVIGEGPHSTINRVMFALALDPSILVRRRAELAL